MPDYFLDTSGLVKHYHAEAGTPEVDRLWADPGVKLFISRLSILETISVFAKKVRTSQITVAEFGLMRRRYFADLRHRRPPIVRVLVRHYQEADRLIQRHGMTHGLYALDALQLAVAVDLKHRGMLDTLVTADSVLQTVAVLEGINVFNPEHP